MPAWNARGHGARERSSALSSTKQKVTTKPTDVFDSDAARLAASAERSRTADTALAGALHRPPPTGAAASARYFEHLARRPPVEPQRERELVAAAQAGDPAARGRLVEAFVPLISSTARI